MRRADPIRSSASAALRTTLVCLALLIGFAGIAVQLVRLALDGRPTARLAMSAPISESYSRPDILDRDGNVLAQDILTPSITADPSRILDIDEAVEELTPELPAADAARLRGNLSDRGRRFIWVARKVSPKRAQKIHDLGVPGVGYRWETLRTYPAGYAAGHLLGAVDAANAGIGGLEKYLDTQIGLRMARTELGDPRPPLRTTLSLAAQHGLEDELRQALARYDAEAATGLVMDVATGEIAAAASLPSVDPALPGQWIKDGPIDRLTRGTFELGSVFKLVTAAAALESGLYGLSTMVDVGTPIRIGSAIVESDFPEGTQFSLRDVIVRSNNIGSANVARGIGAKAQRTFLARLGLLGPTETEAGRVKTPVWPRDWGPASVVTISYGHGIAVAPIQFAAAIASLVNGGFAVSPTFVRDHAIPSIARKRVVSERTSAAVREIMRAVVSEPRGTGRAAAVAGYDVGGKTGTADQPEGRAGYTGSSVITSFVGAFPIENPRFLVMVTLHAPKPTEHARTRYAAHNAAPTAGRIIERVAPLLEIFPQPSPQDIARN